MSFKVMTQYPVAVDSLDHQHPKGTRLDNNSWPLFLDEMEIRFGKFRLLDLGCAGGQFVADWLARGGEAVGLEGSDYSLKAGRANWPTLAGSALFTCDISRSFEVQAWSARAQAHTLAQFQVVTAIEVLEHIPRLRLDQLMRNIRKHLTADGIFVGCIGTKHDPYEGVNLHATMRNADWWREYLSQWFDVDADSGIVNWPRHKHEASLSVCCVRKAR